MTDDHDDTTKAINDSHDVELTLSTLLRYAILVGLLIFSIILVGALMFTGNTRVSEETNPWVAVVVCVSRRCIVLLAWKDGSSMLNFIALKVALNLLNFL